MAHNNLDNSEYLTTVSKKDELLGVANGSEADLKLQKDYFDYLMKRADIEAAKDKKIKVDGEDVPISNFLVGNSEHENVRLKMIRLVNNLGVSHPVVQELLDTFQTDSVFEMCTKYASYILSKSRQERMFALLNGEYKGEADNTSIYKSLVSDKTADRNAASSAWKSGAVTIGSYSGFRKA